MEMSRSTTSVTATRGEVLHARGLAMQPPPKVPPLWVLRRSICCGPMYTAIHLGSTTVRCSYSIPWMMPETLRGSCGSCASVLTYTALSGRVKLTRRNVTLRTQLTCGCGGTDPTLMPTPFVTAMSSTSTFSVQAASTGLSGEASGPPSCGLTHTASSKFSMTQSCTWMSRPPTSMPSVFSGNIGRCCRKSSRSTKPEEEEPPPLGKPRGLSLSSGGLFLAMAVVTERTLAR
mmetsp:Transcript_24205/g.59438  ORF Transcript_24205/g.59438 Transcript_24205/m.59438 type:complete len:232 (+) Transcript_24205:229-924(+)